MYASVHADRSGRVLVSEDHRAAAWDGDATALLTGAIPVPPGTDLVPLEREAIAIDRTGRPRALGRDRHAVAAVLTSAHLRLLLPSYVDDPGTALAPRAYAAVGADPSGGLVVAATAVGPERAEEALAFDAAAALRGRPANALTRQLARCARDHACRAARAALAGRGELPVPLGAPPAERPRLPLALRSAYPGDPHEPAAFKPSAAEIAAVANDHLARGGTRVAFGRACDGEPLLAVRVMEDAVAMIRAAHPRADISLETAGCDAAALRRAIDAGLSRVIIRTASARADTYEQLHAPVAHRWADVRASIQLVAQRGLPLTIALLAHPGITDRPAEADALVALLGDLPGGTLEIRDLGSDPARVIAALPRARPIGMRVLLARLAEADHFPLRAPREPAAVP